MTRHLCPVHRDHYIYRQAHEAEPVRYRPSLGDVLTVAVLFGAYYFWLAWATSL